MDSKNNARGVQFIVVGEMSLLRPMRSREYTHKWMMTMMMVIMMMLRRARYGLD
jgi:hypothetical protein